LSIPIDNLHPWSPESPFLSSLISNLTDDKGNLLDESHATFGMREFEIRGPDFFLNGKKIFLRGGNIAFHRFLSDKDRKLLPWDQNWIRKVLVDIPKLHNFNFFRAHIGHMYNRWYDIADEGGIMLQDEWQFWTTTGTKEQIEKEFSDWLKDNWNHPSIVIWDALNESSDKVVQEEIVPKMKELDPTRPWESYDFFEDHPYIYSLGPVLVDRKFGYTRSPDEIKSSKYPSQINEYLWWWLDKDFKPSELTRKVVTRWLGEDYTETELIEFQSFLASELTGLFRRLDVKSIQPFVYLSANEGPTSHWFVGDIALLKPKPVLEALRNSFEPFGVSIELWDRHFYSGEERKMVIHVFNDYPEKRDGKLNLGIIGSAGKWISSPEVAISAAESSHEILNIELKFPDDAGDYQVVAELRDGENGRIALSKKIAHVYDSNSVDASILLRKIGIIENDNEVFQYLKSRGLDVHTISYRIDESFNIIIVAGETLRAKLFSDLKTQLEAFVQKGGALVCIEPERGVEESTKILLPGGRILEIEPRVDANEGGYDSYIIPDDIAHPLWNGIRKIDLRLFNGGFGGEAVPQRDLKIDGAYKVLARSGLGLKRPVIMELEFGNGYIIISSAVMKGRLLETEGCYQDIFAKRADPIVQRFLMNIINVYGTR
jgi:Glycosyl hydrolases family 2, TIM barrel domain/Glycosyl hydrolases family 2